MSSSGFPGRLRVVAVVPAPAFVHRMQSLDHCVTLDLTGRGDASARSRGG